MTTEPPNAICLGGPCHGKLVRIDQDIGSVVVPLTACGHCCAKDIHDPR